MDKRYTIEEIEQIINKLIRGKEFYTKPKDEERESLMRFFYRSALTDLQRELDPLPTEECKHKKYVKALGMEGTSLDAVASFCCCNLDNPTPPIPDNGWRERFREDFVEYDYVECDPSSLEKFIAQELHTAIEEERNGFREFLFHSLIKSQLENEMKYGDGTGKQKPDFERVINLALAKYSPSDKETT